MAVLLPRDLLDVDLALGAELWLIESPPVATKSVSLVFPSEGLTTGVQVSNEGDALYRLREHPLLSEQAAYGDLIRCRDLGDDQLEFLEVVEASDLERVDYVLSLSLIESAGVAVVLAKVMETGGFWQRDFGGCLTIFFHTDRYDPRDGLEKVNG